jgi:phage major head subunit gpT-like protein
MLVNANTIKGIFRSLSDSFQNGYSAAAVKWDKIATLVPSTTKTNDYGWLTKFPRMQKWVGDKNLKVLSALGYSITNDDYEATVEVDRNDIEDDNLGLYDSLGMGAGESAKQLPDDVVFGLVDGAFTTLCHDGQNFIDTDHPVTDAAGVVTFVSNRLEKALSIDTLAKARASFGAAKTMMQGFTADGGIKLGNMVDILLVGNALEDTAKALMTSERLEDGKVNIYRNAAEVVVSTKISSPTAWFVLSTKGPLKPFIYQERKKPVMCNQMDMSSDSVFSRRKFKFGAEARCAGGYGLWQTAVGSTGEDNT